MKKIQAFSVMALLLTFCVSMSSCQVIGDIFKAGVGVGIFIVVAVIGVIIFIIAKATGK